MVSVTDLRLHTCPCCGARSLPLIDAVTAVLDMEPDATLGRVLWLVGSGDVSMVATMMRMVRLRRGSVVTSITTQPTAFGTCPHNPRVPTGSLRASSSGAGSS